MARKKKNYWYVIVMTGDGPVFVTKVNYSDKTAEWHKDEKPLEMSEFMAKDLAMGLMCNMTSAYAVCNFYELDYQPYFYSEGHFEWVLNKKEEKDGVQ